MNLSCFCFVFCTCFDASMLNNPNQRWMSSKRFDECAILHFSGDFCFILLCAYLAPSQRRCGLGLNICATGIRTECEKCTVPLDTWISKPDFLLDGKPPKFFRFFPRSGKK